MNDMEEQTQVVEGNGNKEDILNYQQRIRLKTTMKKFISPVEAETLLVRKAITHGDIEVFMNGRLCALKTSHLLSMDDLNTLEEFIKINLLPTLRGKRYIWSNVEYNYTVDDVQKEVNDELITLLSRALTEDDQDKFLNMLNNRIKSIYGTEVSIKDLNPEQIMIFNRLLHTELVKLLTKVRKNGR